MRLNTEANRDSLTCFFPCFPKFALNSDWFIGWCLCVRCYRRIYTVLEAISNRSNDEGYVNEKGKKAIGLDGQNNNFARASRFAVTARLRRENGEFHVLRRM